MRQLDALHRRLDPAEGMATHHNLVGGKDQVELLLLLFSMAFGEDELVEGEQQSTSGAVSTRRARALASLAQHSGGLVVSMVWGG